MRFSIAKEARNRNISLLSSKLNIELRNKLVRFYAWNIAFHDSETWTLRKLEQNYFESFEMWCWRGMGEIK